MMKRCTKCGTQKTIDNFYRAKGTVDGHRGECKACFAARAKERYLADPALAKARVKRWQQANPERLNAYRRGRRMEPEVKRAERAGHLKRKYGLTIEQYEEILAAQGGGCAVCGQPSNSKFSLHIDHDHVTGRIRGILCFKHNNALGDFDDDPALLEKAATYLYSFDEVVVEEVAVARQRARDLVGA